MPASHSRKPRRTTYHHGDLRAALLRSALDILREHGADALTLRGVARAAGVSQSAPYRHFADRRALVAAVAEQGFESLGAALQRGMAEAEGRVGLRNVAVAYVRFGHEHRAEYRVMFGAELADTADLPSLRATSRSVLQFVEHGIAGLQAAKLVGPGDPAAMAATTWSMLHGLVMLSIDRQLDELELSLDQLVASATQIMMFGMSAGARS